MLFKAKWCPSPLPSIPVVQRKAVNYVAKLGNWLRVRDSIIPERPKFLELEFMQFKPSQLRLGNIPSIRWSILLALFSLSDSKIVLSSNSYDRWFHSKPSLTVEGNEWQGQRLCHKKGSEESSLVFFFFSCLSSPFNESERTFIGSVQWTSYERWKSPTTTTWPRFLEPLGKGFQRHTEIGRQMALLSLGMARFWGVGTGVGNRFWIKDHQIWLCEVWGPPNILEGS